MKRRGFLTSSVAILTSILAGCGGSSGGGSGLDVSGEVTSNVYDNVNVVDHTPQVDEVQGSERLQVHVTLENTGDGEKTPKLVGTFFDEGGTKIGRCRVLSI